MFSLRILRVCMTFRGWYYRVRIFFLRRERYFLELCVVFFPRYCFHFMYLSSFLFLGSRSQSLFLTVTLILLVFGLKTPRENDKGKGGEDVRKNIQPLTSSLVSKFFPVSFFFFLFFFSYFFWNSFVLKSLRLVCPGELHYSTGLRNFLFLLSEGKSLHHIVFTCVTGPFLESLSSCFESISFPYLQSLEIRGPLSGGGCRFSFLHGR